MANLEQQLLNRYDELCAIPNYEITNEDLSVVLDNYLKRKPKRKKKGLEGLTLLDYYKRFIEYYPEHPNPTTGKPLRPGTLKGMRNFYRCLKHFNDTEIHVDFHNIDQRPYDTFVGYIADREFPVNYQNSHLKELKTIMNSTLEACMIVLNTEKNTLRFLKKRSTTSI